MDTTGGLLAAPGISRCEPLVKDQGNKEDFGKLRWDLLPVGPLQQVVEVYTMGVKKYADRNWEKGLTWGRVFAAMMRHAWAWWGGERRDQENGQHHLASVVWAALALMEYESTHQELDDRPQHKPNASPGVPSGDRSWQDVERSRIFESAKRHVDSYRNDLKILRKCDPSGYKEERE